MKSEPTTGAGPPGTSTDVSTTLDRFPLLSWTAVVTVNWPGGRSGVRKNTRLPPFAFARSSSDPVS